MISSYWFWIIIICCTNSIFIENWMVHFLIIRNNCLDTSSSKSLIWKAFDRKPFVQKPFFQKSFVIKPFVQKPLVQKSFVPRLFTRKPFCQKVQSIRAPKFWRIWGSDNIAQMQSRSPAGPPRCVKTGQLFRFIEI